jgi:hypothetical protein
MKQRRSSLACGERLDTLEKMVAQTTRSSPSLPACLPGSAPPHSQTTGLSC